MSASRDSVAVALLLVASIAVAQEHPRTRWSGLSDWAVAAAVNGESNRALSERAEKVAAENGFSPSGKATSPRTGFVGVDIRCWAAGEGEPEMFCLVETAVLRLADLGHGNVHLVSISNRIALCLRQELTRVVDQQIQSLASEMHNAREPNA